MEHEAGSAWSQAQRHRAKTLGSWKVRVLQRFAQKHRFPSSPGSLCDRFIHGQQAQLRSGKALVGWVPAGHDGRHFSQARLHSHSQDQGGNFCTCISLRHPLSNKISLKKPWSPLLRGQTSTGEHITSAPSAQTGLQMPREGPRYVVCLNRNTAFPYILMR